MTLTRFHPAEYWHLLSLDAPTVAALWSYFLARAMQLTLPMGAPFLLAAGAWLLYVGDRILDGMRAGRPELLRERHLFHRRHRRAFLLVALVVALWLAWTILTRMDRRALREDAFLSIFAALYLFAVHFDHRRGRAPWLPKELAVALLFAAATAVPAWSRVLAGRPRLAIATGLFALLCWINTVAIETWERQRPGAYPNGAPLTPQQAHLTTLWAGRHLSLVIALAAGASLLAGLAAPTRSLLAVYLATLSSAAVFFLLHKRRARLSPLHLRVAADAALLTPVLFLPLTR